MSRMTRMSCMLLLGSAPFIGFAGEVFNQPPDPNGGLYQSSRMYPDGSDYDQWVWDNFTLPVDTDITEIRWRGGFIYGGGWGGPVLDFTVDFYPTISAGTEPDVLHRMVHLHTGGNAGETYAGQFGGAAMYDYHFTLPTPFHAVGGTKYWVQIEANQQGIPEWACARGTGGNNVHFRRLAEGMFHFITGDTAFSLYDDSQPPQLGDLNCDGVIDAFDIEPFILALTDPAGYALQHPECDRNLADVNDDGAVDAFDIEPFIGLLLPP